MKNVTIGAIIIMLLGVAAFAYYTLYIDVPEAAPVAAVETPQPQQPQDQPAAANPAPAGGVRAPQAAIGKSVQDRNIVAYHFGTGPKELLIVGGVHGSYSANTEQAVEEAVIWLKENPSVLPAEVSVTVIPQLNPDGMLQEHMRFNAHNVDLNRNFDCDWKAEGMWQNKKVSGGTAAFSEPESKAIQNFVETYKPAAAVVFYSAAGGVYASACDGAISAETKSLLATYASASGYPAHDTFDAYEVSGDMVNWFAKMGIPAISVLLTNHDDTDWAMNEKGLTAVLKSLAQ